MIQLKHFFAIVALSCSTFAMASQSTDLVQDIEEVKAAINERIDEEAVKFITDPNMSEKRKKYCIHELKKAFGSSKKIKETREVSQDGPTE